VFVGVDVRSSLGLWLIHCGDTWRPLAPETVGPHLAAAGFLEIAIDVRPGYFRFFGHSHT